MVPKRLFSLWMVFVFFLSSCNVPGGGETALPRPPTATANPITDSVIARPPTATANPITDSVIPGPLRIAIFPAREGVLYGVCARQFTRMSINVRLSGLTADVAQVEMSWGFGYADGSAPPVTGPNGEDWRPMEPNPSLGPGEYVLEDIPFGEVVLNWGLSGAGSYVITIAARALDAAGNELGMNRRQIQFNPCNLPADFVEDTLYMHGVVEPEVVWQCPDDPDAALVYISAELFDPAGAVSRVIATNRLVSASGANSGSQGALELMRGSRTPAGGWYYSGILDTRLYDFSRLTDLEYGLQIFLQAQDASGTPVYSVLDPYVVRFRIDCYTDTSAGADAGKQDSATATPESAGPKTFVLSRNAVCRAGPSFDYKIAEYINAGDSVPAQARSANSAWLVVLLPNGVRCWVSLQNGTLDGDPNELPEEKAPEITVPPTKSSGDGQQGGGSAVDADGDGYTSDVDCNDGTDKIHPGVDDYPDDGVDSNCNGDDNS